MFFHSINYWAVLVSGVASMILGYLWYSSWAFGKTWAHAKGFTEADMKAHQESGKSMAPSMIAMFVSSLVTAFIIAALFGSLIITTISGMLILAFCLWIALTVRVALSEYLFGQAKITAVLISAGYELVVIAVMCLIIGLWN